MTTIRQLLREKGHKIISIGPDIVVTQDHSSWKDIGHRWGHRGAVQFQMVRDNPVIGTEIRSQSDALKGIP